ncbi:MAG: Formation of crista junctions protein 1 [Cirrosporium novae-zelandiae]|nr:MAG: Formation of crista junctions protein 1 [Cirrosporium novae-zelandiae]
MLRASLQPVKWHLRGPIVRRTNVQWPGRSQLTVGQRFYADNKPSIRSSEPPVLPGSQSKTPHPPAPPPPGSVATPSSDTTIPPENVPLTPPPPPGGKTQTSPPSSIPRASRSTPRPPPQPPIKPKKKRRFRRFLLTLILLTGLGYGGGIWYALRSDNFHDFFTEFVPGGEDAVLYFEEKEFHRKFPNSRMAPRPTTDRDERKVTIPSKSGISWRVADEGSKGSEITGKGRHMNALDANQSPEDARGKDKAVQKPKKGSAPPTTKAAKKGTSEPEKPKPSPPVDDRKALIPTTTHIDPLETKETDEPLIQDLVKVINGLITVVNADNAADKYATSMNKAKDDLAAIGKRILDLKKSEVQAAEGKLRSQRAEFEDAARELVRKVEEVQREDELRFREEFEAEREKITRSYAERLRTEVEREKEVAERRLQNALLEQAVDMKRKFMEEIKERVETERNGRLSKLSELSSNLTDLEKLADGWNGVIDTNLKTQHLQVAVDAVRSTLEHADRPKPFVRELAALKEIAEDDAVVNAAIASINPTAYQHGIPTGPQLIDRFRRVASEVRKASLLPEDAGVASHAASFVLSKLLFRKSGLAVGDDVESILTRTETYLEEGNFDEAAREMNGLQGWAKTLSKDWLKDVRRVLEVQQALDVS